MHSLATLQNKGQTMKVQHRFSNKKGVIVEMLPGIYDLARVKFAQYDFTVVLPLSDLIILD